MVNPDQKLLAFYANRPIDNGRPSSATVVATAETVVPRIEGESTARRRKAAKRRPDQCPIASAEKCLRRFKGKACCKAILVDHACSPPAVVRLLFVRGSGLISEDYIRIAAAVYRDAKSAD